MSVKENLCGIKLMEIFFQTFLKRYFIYLKVFNLLLLLAPATTIVDPSEKSASDVISQIKNI